MDIRDMAGYSSGQNDKLKKAEELRAQILNNNFEYNKIYFNILDKLEYAKDKSWYFTTIERDTPYLILQHLIESGYYISAPIKVNNNSNRLITWAGELGLSEAIDYISKLNN